MGRPSGRLVRPPDVACPLSLFPRHLNDFGAGYPHRLCSLSAALKPRPFSDKGALRTHSPDTYKIPALGDAPRAFHVDLLSDADQDDVIHKSKAVGEPPFVGAIAVLGAIRQAIGAFRADKGGSRELERLHIPCTPEGVLRAIEGC